MMEEIYDDLLKNGKNNPTDLDEQVVSDAVESKNDEFPFSDSVLKGKMAKTHIFKDSSKNGSASNV